MIKILIKHLGPYGFTCCGHSSQPDFSKWLVSWCHWSRFHDIKNFNAVYNTSQQAIEMGLLFIDKKSEKKQLWREFFSDPSGWWDHRVGKMDSRFPYFKKTLESLWLDSKCVPPWVEAKLATIASGALKSGISWNHETTLTNGVHNGGKEGEGKTSKWIPIWEEAKVPRKGSGDLESTFSSEVMQSYRCKKKKIEMFWRELFLYPSEWEDHRLDKENPRFPDFRHNKHTHKALWVTSGWIPTWVEEKLAVLPPGIIQSSPFSWNQKLLGHVQAGQYEKTMELFQQMRQDGITANKFTFPPVLKACAGLGLLEHGRQIHAMMPSGSEADLFIGSSLVDMYAKCGSIKEAEGVFNHMPTRNVVAWTAMIRGYVKCGEGQKALKLFERMKLQGVDPDRVTFVSVLNACASLAALEGGRRAHQEIICRGFELDTVLGNCLVDMYAKCGSIEEAEKVFYQMPKRDVIAWNSVIHGYTKCGQGEKALKLFEQMQQQGVDPSLVTFVGILNLCARMANLERGRHAHEEIVRRGYESNVVLGNCLVDMYSKCGSISDAERVFNHMPTKDVVAWTSMILGYGKCGEGQKALKLFEQMQLERVDPDSLTYVGVLGACASVAALERGRHAHQEIVRRGFESDVVVGTCLVDMYAKCGSIEEAESVFNRMPTRNVVAWNAMIFGYMKCGEGHKALELYEQMQQQGVEIDSLTFVGVLSACASFTALERGRSVHQDIIWRGYESDAVVGNCLVDMYVTCGSIAEAERVFNQMPTRDVVAWTALLAGYGSHGYAKEALEHFNQMCKVVKVNGVTFICLLTACNHGGLVDDGLEYFKSISAVHNISPTVEHYACVVDLLGRAGRFCEAEDLIMSMPMDPNAAVWMSLLAACREHVNVELGERCAKHLLDLEPENGAAFVLLADIYAATGKESTAGEVGYELKTNFRACID